jgi:hypothetical protein
LKRPVHPAVLLGLAPLATVLAVAALGLGQAGYAPPRSTIPADTVRPKPEARALTDGTELGAAIPGYLSSWGLPPVRGQIVLTDTGLVFHASRGTVSAHAGSVALAYVDDENGRAHYLFRVDAGVFETEAPGALLAVATDPAWSSPGAGTRTISHPMLGGADRASSLSAARRIARSSYADSLYLLFGKPRAPIGLIGPRGIKAGRLGEYILRWDSLAFDPARMTGETQFRHALAHELGHRWQARAKGQLTTLWSGVRGIRDPKRYGYGNLSEHQAEAIAFAVSFLQTTASSSEPPAGALALLDHYDLLVPGTRTMVRFLALQPPYRHHPLRSRLTSGRITYALEK